jgi:beta-hydroxylase
VFTGDFGMIGHFFAPQLLVLYCFAIAAMIVHFRGRVRLGFFRQLTDHSTLLAPYNVLMYWFSAVPSAPVLPSESIPELAKLRENWKMIREEALALNNEGRIKAADKYNDFGFNSFFRTGWKRFYLKWYDEPLPSAKAACPKTVELLESIPGIEGAMFATLGPNSRLVRHRDPYAGSLRYHLGLVTPTSPGECRIFVDGQSYTWHDGEDLLFDETYVHYAENTTNETRIILFCDVERPLRTRAMTAVNRWVCHHIVRQTKTQNVEGEEVGAFNKAFAYIYQVRLVGKRMKAWNRNVYYAVKFSLIGGILAAVAYSVFA